MAEANRAERHAWAERCAAAARSPEAHKYLGFQVIKAEPCPGLLAAVLPLAFIKYQPSQGWRG
jgi:hypothetical protein